MHWYGGSIAEAVALSKQRNAIFVVFVEDDNELSAEMAATIDNETIVRRLANLTNFLAIKLKSGSANYTHFAQIYQFVPVPSLFFIGRNGTPLEVVCAGVQPANLAERIDRILDEHHKLKPATLQPSTSSESVKAETTNLLQAEAASAAQANSPATDTPQKPESVQQKPESVPQKPESVPQKPESVPQKPESVPQKPESVPQIGDSAPQNLDSGPQKLDSGPQKLDSGPQNSDQGPPAKIQKTSDPEYEVVCDGDVCVRKPKDGASTSGQAPELASEPPVPVQESTSDVSIDAKVDRAKELLEARRREKAEKEKQLEKEKELERRNLGQGVAELKRWQAEQDLKLIQEERKREKMENNAARQRILEQIAQDRAERRARDSRPPAPAAAPAAPVAPATSGDAHSQARIQFKLPDGTSHTASFAAADTLRSVQRYVTDNLQLPAASFSLWTAFPRRELSAPESTLRELQLAPSAALLVLPRRAAAAPPQAHSTFSVISFVTQLLTSLIYEPTVQLYTWLRTRLFPPPAVSPPRPRSPSAPVARPPTGAPQPLRRRGNVHRLPGDAPDDDNNTWNGNSTQQM